MPGRFTLPHIDITARSTSQIYKGEGTTVRGTPRDRIEHGRRVQSELREALAAADRLRPLDDRLPPSAGVYLEVELDRGKRPDVLDVKKQGVRAGAAKVDAQSRRIISLYVPDHARPAFEQIVDDYLNGPLTEKAKQPKNRDKVEAIEAIRVAHLATRWTDPKPITGDTQTSMWWALWSHKDRVDGVLDICARLKVRVADEDRRMTFPEVVVVPVLANRATVELMMFASDGIAELRFANDTPTFFLDDIAGEQHEWVDGLAERIRWPGAEAPAVCILDAGINRGHSLIEAALAPSDMHALEPEDWGVDDHEPQGHGTSMAGLALHGDLTAALSDRSERVLAHRLESVKVLPPDGFDPNEPQSYGVLTQAAVVLPEIEAPERQRVYCMALSNDNVSGAYASLWSAALDQAAVGRMVADDDNIEGDAQRPRRLIIVSAGNVPAETDFAARRPQDDFPIEDPAQAWNALTVGAYTDLIHITDVGYTDWTPMAEVGEISPHSRTSTQWKHGTTAIKPEIVLEGGNRAVSPARTDMITVDSLSLLTTGKDIAGAPLVAFDATSAAAAQAGRIAAQLMAEHPDYWPETIRALMVHSAEWTSAMWDLIARTTNKRERYQLVRRFGYGVASHERATACARNHLAMVAQANIQPYRFEGGREFNECHYYRLPIPAAMLEKLNNEPVELKVTLSYFIDPNPGLSANVDPQRYQSHGLRFDLQRRNEPLNRFKLRVNAAEHGAVRQKLKHEGADSRWILGDDSVSAGSLHCDVWAGPAIDLLQRDTLCIKPVNGWCRKRSDEKVCNRHTRYALVVSFKALDADLDIYTPIATAVQIPIPIETQV
ncbi:MAG TPA: S8 family peptidase [Bradyrhizobium sp.]|nr:S8 family peptidase [Bradyrhizobium sp.]